MYLQDTISPVYLDGSEKIWWDRYNSGLDQHVYTHQEILRTRPEGGEKKYAWLIESKAILPEDYLLFDKNPGLADQFDLIFTWDADLLTRHSHARFVPAMYYWYGRATCQESPCGGSLSEDAWRRKTKNISMMASEKTMTPIQVMRIELARYLKRLGMADTYGRFDGGPFLTDKSVTLTDYRYTIAIENDIQPLYFTEKILDCFASMTVPIYYGATDIGSYFNMDGIIQIRPNETNQVEKILARCCEEDYGARREAILDNYRRVMEYSSLSDYIWNHYLAD